MSGDPSPDRLRDVFDRQAALAEFYAKVRPSGFYASPPRERLTTWTRAIVHECCELDNELSWKPWKNPTPDEETRAARVEEMADIFHFFVQLALDQGISADELYAAYVRKNEQNRVRQESDPAYTPETASANR